ncbi:hypothetical protein CYMTET_16234 [Cymbomonas tetramitiformis]|uniref:Uncharacterized protein n=1 Tax=Cymbomonas tetramitiformis TaxID=36881 RepID=A0AAE0GCM3_9CHLO|nr:hypothetical protein CYMTET_16234 [Cymbomonas tetramitiformis]
MCLQLATESAAELQKLQRREERRIHRARVSQHFSALADESDPSGKSEPKPVVQATTVIFEEDMDRNDSTKLSFRKLSMYSCTRARKKKTGQSSCKTLCYSMKTPPFNEREQGTVWVVARPFVGTDADGEVSNEYLTSGTSLKGLTGGDGTIDSQYYFALGAFIAELDSKFMMKGTQEKILSDIYYIGF